jgi:hypothetical protein
MTEVLSPRPWLEDVDDSDSRKGREQDIDVNDELKALIDEYIAKERKLKRARELSAGRTPSNEVPAYISLKVAAMLDVLDSGELKNGKSLSDIVEEQTTLLREAAQEIRDAHGPLQGARYIEPEWDAAADRPKGVGYREPGEEYPAEIAKQLQELHIKEDALTALRIVADELIEIKEGSHPTWSLPGDIDGDARIDLIGKIGRDLPRI